MEISAGISLLFLDSRSLEMVFLHWLLGRTWKWSLVQSPERWGWKLWLIWKSGIVLDCSLMVSLKQILFHSCMYIHIFPLEFLSFQQLLMWSIVSASWIVCVEGRKETGKEELWICSAWSHKHDMGFTSIFCLSEQEINYSVEMKSEGGMKQRFRFMEI